MISKNFRFHSHASLKYVFAKGQMARSRWFAIKFLPNSRRKYSRIAVVVSKKIFAHAVDRNRARRRIYEITRPFVANSNQPIDAVVSVYSPEILAASSDELSLQLLPLLRKAGFQAKQSRTSKVCGGESCAKKLREA